MQSKLIPELCVHDIGKSIDFYTKVLGFKIEYQRVEDKFAFILFQGSQLMLEENSDSPWHTGKLEYPLGRGINFQIQVDDIGKLYSRLRKLNIGVKKELSDNWYRQNSLELGNREFLIQDPDGYVLRFFENIGKRKLKQRKP